MEIYKKRGRWSVRNDQGRLEAKFATETEAKDFAKASLGYKEPSTSCLSCECDPCECEKIVEEVKPFKATPKEKELEPFKDTTKENGEKW